MDSKTVLPKPESEEANFKRKLSDLIIIAYYECREELNPDDPPEGSLAAAMEITQMAGMVWEPSLYTAILNVCDKSEISTPDNAKTLSEKIALERGAAPNW